ncbi:FtsX-like permease family protein [Paenibacillus polygoni]|uniref:FtsX-like permease family protein n=1 Tax=Paenibacillus polygoni TaxID=3050112 RepID=A0ABY8X6B7_9BACL|nr:ABC transporter permease [Paenibacillus polygoni]WIV21075.1 FtsX-like permease family protein [Paenibacillus polygoni]
MNIVNKLTLRHLRLNKRRTLVTILGVIISVAMIIAVASLGVSFLDLMKRQSIATEGEWHVQYHNVNKAQLNVIEADEATKKLVISKDLGYAPLEGSQNDNKPYLYIKSYNEKGFEQFPIELMEGRFPQAKNELIISEEIASNAKVDYKVGDSITLQVGERITTGDDESENYDLNQNESLRKMNDRMEERLQNQTTQEYTVVGIIKRPEWEPAQAPGYTAISYFDENLMSAGDKVTATVVLKKMDNSLYAHAKELAKNNHIEKIVYNNSLLRYSGVTSNSDLRTMLFSLSAIIMTIIMVGSIALIYNAFAISVSERARHLGMLASVGATKRQKRNSVYFEGFVIGIISIPLGIIFGLAGIAITFVCINPLIQGVLGVSEKLTVTITPSTILITCLVSMLTIFISTYIPARKASKISAIDAIRQTQDVKLTRKAVKTSKFVRKVFGMEAEIGLKNLKRNKRRYQATVFSLVISIILFLSIAFFTSMMQKSIELSSSGLNYDILVQMELDTEEETAELVNSITALPNVTDANYIQSLEANSLIDRAFIADELKETLKEDESILKDGKYPYYIQISALDDINLKAYAEKAGADYDQLIDLDEPAAIVINQNRYEDYETRKNVETKAIYLEKGDQIDLNYTDWDTEEETSMEPIKIAALTEELPLGITPSYLGNLNIVVSDQVFKTLVTDSMKKNMRDSLYLSSSDPLALQYSIEEMKENNIYINNVYKNRQGEEQMVLLMSVFTYGFIALITLISVANIFNTISTSISLRKREFAMLKSMGMTPKGFRKMINYESIFYGIKSLLYGLPISILAMYLIYRSMMNSFTFGFSLPWLSILFVILAVFLIVSAAMLYSSSKVKKENIIDALKQENI